MTNQNTAQTYEPVGPALVADVAKCPPTEGPYKWAEDVWASDSFVFRADAVRDISNAEFA